MSNIIKDLLTEYGLGIDNEIVYNSFVSFLAVIVMLGIILMISKLVSPSASRTRAVLTTAVIVVSAILIVFNAVVGIGGNVIIKEENVPPTINTIANVDTMVNLQYTNATIETDIPNNIGGRIVFELDDVSTNSNWIKLTPNTITETIEYSNPIQLNIDGWGVIEIIKAEPSGSAIKCYYETRPDDFTPDVWVEVTVLGYQMQEVKNIPILNTVYQTIYNTTITDGFTDEQLTELNVDVDTWKQYTYITDEKNYNYVYEMPCLIIGDSYITPKIQGDLLTYTHNEEIVGYVYSNIEGVQCIISNTIDSIAIVRHK